MDDILLRNKLRLFSKSQKIYIRKYRVSQEECARLRESVP